MHVAYVEALAPNVTTFEDRFSKVVIEVKWGHKGGLLIQWDGCPYKERKQHQACAHREDHGEDTEEGSRLQTKERDLRETNLPDILILDF